MAQRVSSARVEVDGEVVARMEGGLLALVGVGRADDERDAAELARKLVHLRIFPDEEGRMNRSLLDSGGVLGVVSQFTLWGDTRKGRRPAFTEAAPPERAAPLVTAVVEAAQALGVTVVTGIVVACLVFVVVLLLLKLLWAWTVPDLFPGAVENGLVAKSISWYTAMKVAIFIAVLSGFARGRVERRHG